MVNDVSKNVITTLADTVNRRRSDGSADDDSAKGWFLTRPQRFEGHCVVRSPRSFSVDLFTIRIDLEFGGPVENRHAPRLWICRDGVPSISLLIRLNDELYPVNLFFSPPLSFGSQQRTVYREKGHPSFPSTRPVTLKTSVI